MIKKKIVCIIFLPHSKYNISTFRQQMNQTGLPKRHSQIQPKDRYSRKTKWNKLDLCSEHQLVTSLVSQASQTSGMTVRNPRGSFPKAKKKLCGLYVKLAVMNRSKLKMMKQAEDLTEVWESCLTLRVCLGVQHSGLSTCLANARSGV